MNKWIGIPLCAFILANCSGLQMTKVPEYEYRTTFENGKVRTVFKQKGQKVTSIKLFDSNGDLVLNWAGTDTLPTDSLEYKTSEYSYETKKTRYELESQVGPLVSELGKKNSEQFEKGRFGADALYIIWINPLGEAEHAVCLENNNVPIGLVNSTVIDIESWKLASKEPGVMTIIKQRIYYNE